MAPLDYQLTNFSNEQTLISIGEKEMDKPLATVDIFTAKPHRLFGSHGWVPDSGAVAQGSIPVSINTRGLKVVNPSRPNSDLSQISHCNIKGLSVRQVMRISRELRT